MSNKQVLILESLLTFRKMAFFWCFVGGFFWPSVGGRVPKSQFFWELHCGAFCWNISESLSHYWKIVVSLVLVVLTVEINWVNSAHLGSSQIVNELKASHWTISAFCKLSTIYKLHIPAMVVKWWKKLLSIVTDVWMILWLHWINFPLSHCRFSCQLPSWKKSILFGTAPFDLKASNTSQLVKFSWPVDSSSLICL